MLLFGNKSKVFKGGFIGKIKIGKEKRNYVKVLLKVDIDVFGYNPIIDITRAISPRKTTANVIVNNHPRTNIGLIISKLGGVELEFIL